MIMRTHILPYREIWLLYNPRDSASWTNTLWSLIGGNPTSMDLLRARAAIIVSELRAWKVCNVVELLLDTNQTDCRVDLIGAHY
jgi:hypothetical protein